MFPGDPSGSWSGRRPSIDGRTPARRGAIHWLSISDILPLFDYARYHGKIARYHGKIYGNIPANSKISLGLAAPRNPHGFPRVLGFKKQFLTTMIFDDLQIGL